MKKLLSIILAAAMLLSLVPSVFAVEGEETVYTYNFNSKDTAFDYSSTLSTSTLLKTVTHEDGSVTIENNDTYAEYDDTKGRHWKMFDTVEGVKEKFKDASSKYGVAGFDANALRVNFTAGEQWLALKIRVPEPGIYTMATKINQHRSSRLYKGFMCIYPGSVSASQIVYGQGNNGILNSARLLSSNIIYKDTSLSAATDLDISFGRVLAVSAANEEFIYVLGSVEGNSGTAYVKNFTLTKISDSVTFGDTTAIDLVMGEDETQTVTASLASGKTLQGASKIIYSTENAEVATVEDGVVTAVGEGETTLTARIGDATATIPVKVTAPEKPEVILPEENPITDTTVNFKASAYEGGTVSNATVQEVTIGTDVTVTATPNTGYAFAYWKNSAGVVLSTNATETFKVSANMGVIAVFDKVVAEGENIPVYFYNGNGIPLGDTSVAKDTPFATAKSGANVPAIPTLTGFVFSHWSDKDAETPILDTDAITALTRAVAIYKDADTTFTVKNGTATVASGKKYGESVTVTSTADNFSCWKLGDKVMSYEKNFTFNVYGNITLTEVTGEEIEAAPVLVLDKVDGNYFLTYDEGSYELIEAGILFGSENVSIGSIAGYKAAAKRHTGQFTAQPHEGATSSTIARGYMICKYNDEFKVIYAD